MLISCAFISPSTAQIGNGVSSYATSESGLDVLDVQNMLKALGYDISSLDGQVGPETLNAIRAFQADNGFSVTGNLSSKDGKLLRELYEVSFEQPQRSESRTETTIDQMSSDEAQRILGRLGYYSEQNDDLSAAIINFQNTAGLKKTGQLDAYTSNALAEAVTYIFDDFLPTLQKQASWIEQAKNIQQLMSSQPALFTSMIAQRGLKTEEPNGSSKEAFQRMIRSAVPLIGCVNNSEKIYGFYNVVYNFWIVVTSKDNGEVLDAVLLDDLNKNYRNEKGSWIYNYALGEPIPLSIKRSYKIQTKAFEALLNNEVCAEGAFTHILKTSSISGVSLLREKNAVSVELERGILDQIFIKTKQTEEIEDEYGLTLVAALTMSGQENADLMTFHSLEADPSIIVIQNWSLATGSPQMTARAGVDLVLQEENVD